MSTEEQAKTTRNLSAEKQRLLEQRLKRIAKHSAHRPATIPARDDDQPSLASLGQARIWVQNDISNNSPSYNITSSFRINSPIQTSALEFAFNQVIARHEPLRSSYSLEDNEIVQHTRTHLNLPLQHQAVDTEKDLFLQAQAFGRQPFDMENGPLLGLALFSYGKSNHVLILSIHDIVFDKWSLKLFWSEFSQFYRQSATQQTAQVPELEIRYSDFSHWQRDWFRNGEESRQTVYWKQQLVDPPPPITLPTDYPYPKFIDDPGSLARAKIPTDLARKLRAFSAENNASLFTTLLLAFNLLLARYAQTDDVLVSSPVANRRKAETANLIGFFLNTLVLRSKLSPDKTILSALEETKITVAQALEHQDLPTDLIADAVKPQRTPGRQPLFQTMFVFQREDEGTPKLELDNCDITPIFVETKTSKFELSLFVAESGSTLETLFEYRTDLFRKETIEHLLKLYERVLQSILDSPNDTVAQIQLLTPNERSQLNTFQNGPPLILPEDKTILAWINNHNTSTKPAIISTSQSLSYAQLTSKSNAIAQALLAEGAEANRPIALIHEREPNAIVAILGILKAGSPYIVIEPDYPDDRIHNIVDDANVRLVLASESQSNRAPLENCTVLQPNALPSVSPLLPLPKLSPQSLAYLLYTSGSTGKPKAVAISHRNLLASTLARLEYYGTDSLSFLLIPNLSFDSSVAGLFWTLATGGSLIFPSAEEIRDPDALCGIASRNHIQATLCVPTLYRQLLSWKPASLLTLSTAIVAGEACPQSLITNHQDTLPHCRLFNEYGPTEATVWATADMCTPSSPVSIGRPIPGATIQILDSSLNPVPIGQTGQIYIGGPGVARGYHEREDLTKQSFIQDRDGNRVYKTGDRGSWTSEGKIIFHGRNDDQVKIRGYRIEIGEIENAIQSLPGVKQSAVVTVSNSYTQFPDSIIESFPIEHIEIILDQIEAETSIASRAIRRDRFHLSLTAQAPDFIKTPRKAQHDWLVGQTLNELADDLTYLDTIAPTFVPGKDHKISTDLIDITQADLSHDEIMEDWQTPLMHAMAGFATENPGHILEIGFGRGVSATFVQEQSPTEHTIIEMNRPCIENHFNPWRQARLNSKINLIEARWQDCLSTLGQFEGILFHAFPMNEQEFMDYVLNSITFAEHAFADMASHLVSGGIFTYLTTEIDSLSRRHQRALFKHFSEVTVKVVPTQVPVDTIDSWWAKSMVAIKAVK